jgi:phospholipase C
METRREFLKKSALLSGAAWASLPAAITKAAAISPKPGSIFLEAEHVVILMQENRSFDHCFGTLRGVRGFGDPRAIKLPNGNPIWLQTNKAGVSYSPFRLNLTESNATWMGSLPHSWTDQVDARNGGRCDQWLDAKRSGHPEYADMPLTMGYYSRDDIPFYHALADAFTICDQHFCSALTGTNANRLYLWSGTIREPQIKDAPARVQNSDTDYGREAQWTTFPERLESQGLSWKVYQNEITLPSGLAGEADAWLANFSDNPLEWFTQFGVRFAAGRGAYLEQQAETLTNDLDTLSQGAAEDAKSSSREAEISKRQTALADIERERAQWSRAKFEQLPWRDRNLHEKAFVTNCGDPKYRQLETLAYQDGGTERQVQAPAGDVLHQFRQDVLNGKLPTVSWLVAPERYSDHPGSAWYGAWYLAEALNILTHDPEVWKKTVFILTYDENDGYFDHIPPFVPPHPTQPNSGLVSKGIDTSVEYVTLEQELARKPESEARESPIGLGYRVPMIIASPWSRGGYVCSQVFDHTSPLQFLEKLLSHKTGREIKETNISQWRRTVCGDLTSAFRTDDDLLTATLAFPDRVENIERIHRAQFEPLPTGFRQLSSADMEAVRAGSAKIAVTPIQESGLRAATPVPYELAVNGKSSSDGESFTIEFVAGNELFGNRAAGAPFIVYARTAPDNLEIRNYAVAAGDRLSDFWPLADADDGAYHFSVYGPNGFYREFRGTRSDPSVSVRISSPAPKAVADARRMRLHMTISCHSADSPCELQIADQSYGGETRRIQLSVGKPQSAVIDLQSSHGWYDLAFMVEGRPKYLQRFAGRVENGRVGVSDPLFG